MELTSSSFADGQPIPERCAFGIPDAREHMRLGQNLSPQLSWRGVPAEARSLILLCIDPDVPSVADDVNQEGKRIPAELPRVDFCHWVLVDLPAADGGLAEGECSDGVVPGGKRNPPGPAGSRQGLNDYTGFMAGDPDMAGEYYGYDGPCPPWNDERLHHYRFTLYATDLPRCPVDGAFTAADVQRALEGHVLAEASITGTYTLNPALR
ncbi:MAG: YbhB/YbcL family Raf kinase inhibitor-like protein [Gammaproteobacteria bacterium]|nr:MAG: YbhB/YbcL family Raf kinase inhibitor-like protein [Gammaproteobacteria bacterium]